MNVAFREMALGRSVAMFNAFPISRMLCVGPRYGSTDVREITLSALKRVGQGAIILPHFSGRAVD